MQSCPTNGLWNLENDDTERVLAVLCTKMPGTRSRGISPKLEKRRKCNRESMQRKRQREREELAKLRAEVDGLSQQYRSLTLLATPSSEISSDEAKRPVKTGLQRYIELSKLVTQLSEQKFMLHRSLQEKRKANERIQQLLDDLARDTEEEAHQAACEAFGFRPLTETRVFELIRDCYRVTQCKQLSSELCSDAAHVDQFFGWRVNRRIVNTTGVVFCAAKTSPTVHAEAVMERGWKAFGLMCNNSMKCRRWVRQDTLQVVNGDTMVIGRDMEHPLHHDRLLRTIYLRFRIETERGYVVGRASTNPPVQDQCRFNEAGVQVEYVDSWMWVEYAYVDPSNRSQAGCTVTFAGFCDYKIPKDLAMRWTNILFTVLQVENVAIQPLVLLLS